MSGELKMGDVFDLPVKHNIDVCKVASERGSAFISAKAVNLKHICHAINNHDRLASERDALKAALRRLVVSSENNIRRRRKAQASMES